MGERKRLPIVVPCQLRGVELEHARPGLTTPGKQLGVMVGGNEPAQHDAPCCGNSWRRRDQARTGRTHGPSDVAERMFYLSPTAVNARRNAAGMRSEEHTSELQSLMRISYAVFCLKKKK